MATIFGTSHFVSQTAAIRYFSLEGYSDAVGYVTDALSDHSISIGKPITAPDERVVLMDGGLRYGIEIDARS